MTTTIYATFKREVDAEQAAYALLDHGVSKEALSYILPDRIVVRQESAHGSRSPAPYVPTPEDVVPLPPPLPHVPHAHTHLLDDEIQGSGYRLDAFGAVIPDRAVVRHAVRPSDPHAGAGEERQRPEPGHAAESGHAERSAATDAALGALEGGAAGLGLAALLGIATVMVPGFGRVAGAGRLVAGLAAATGAAGAAVGGVAGYLVGQGVPPDAARRLEEHVKTAGPIVAVVISGEAAHTEAEGILRKYRATLIEAR